MYPLNGIVTTFALFASPHNMPPLLRVDDDVAASASASASASATADHKRHNTSDYGARTNHPTAYDDNPPFKGPLRLERRPSPDLHRNRIQHYYIDDEKLRDCLQIDELPTLTPATPTGTYLKSIVDHLARRDAPVDAKEVAESVEFYLRCGKRLFGAAKRVIQNNSKSDGQSTIKTGAKKMSVCKFECFKIFNWLDLQTDIFLAPVLFCTFALYHTS